MPLLFITVYKENGGNAVKLLGGMCVSMRTWETISLFAEQTGYIQTDFNPSRKSIFADGCKTPLQLHEYYLLHLFLCFNYFTLKKVPSI